MKIKKGDTIIVTSGKDRTKKGKVLRVFPEIAKVFVEGITRKKHKRSTTQQKKGEVINVPFAISLSAVKLLCPHCGKTTRVGYDVTGDTKQRVCKKCNQHID